MPKLLTKIATLIAAALAVVAVPVSSVADPACWAKKSCASLGGCSLWTDELTPGPAVCRAAFPPALRTAFEGQGCFHRPGKGADACTPTGYWVERSCAPGEPGPCCVLVGKATLLLLSCCTSPCPTGTPWCQED